MINILKKFLFINLIIWSFTSSAQQIELKGSIMNEATLEPIEFATIQIETLKNSRLLGYGFSNEKGIFDIEIDLKKEKEVALVISYLGFMTYKKNLSIDNYQINTGKILLFESSEKLDEVVITATPPVLIKNDTIQYNAASFKTKEDAVAEDLFKKLPGVSINSTTGEILINGVNATKILVNGEPFFSKNPTAAMKILSKDVIDKIVITDTKTDEENFTGSVSSEESKTINITLKKKEKGNLFGNFTAGYGTNNRYETNGVVNRIYKKSLLTALAFSNNINKNNFSYNDDDDSNSLDRSRAIKTESNIGINYSDNLTGNNKINVDYLFSDREINQNNQENRIRLLPNRNNLISQKTANINNQQSHRANVKLTNSIAKNLRIITNAKIYVRNKDSYKQINRETTNENLIKLNNYQGIGKGDQKYKSLRSSMSAIYKIDKFNSFINYRIASSYNSSLNNSKSNSETNFLSNNIRTDLRDLLTEQNRHENKIENSIKYGQNIAKNHVLEYTFFNNNEKQEEEKNVFDIAQMNKRNEWSFDQRINIHKLQHQLAYVFKKEKFFYNLNLKHLNTTLENQEFNRNKKLVKGFKDLLISTKLRYKTSKGLILNTSYRTKSVVPRNNELLTITDNSSPSRIVVGNENLDRELEHLFSFNIRFYNRKKKLNFYNRLSYSTVQDKIVDKSNTTEEDAITTKTYINNSNNNNYSIRGGIVKDYKKDPLFYSLKLSWFSTVGNNSHFINNLSFKSNYFRFSPSFYADLNYNDLFEVSPYYRLLLNKTKYNSDEIQNQSNTQHTFGLKITTFSPKRFTIFNQIEYSLNPKFEKGFGREALVWNIDVNYSIIPNKAKLKLTVFNILNQYNNTTRSFSESNNTTVTYDVLQQYAMLSFKYIFKN